MALTLADIRSKYPQYKDVPDQTLADKLYQKYYSHAERREFDARIGLKPYQNMAEAAAVGVKNLPADIAMSKAGIGRGVVEALQYEIDPAIQKGRTPPLEVTPGAPIEDLLNQPAAATEQGWGLGGRLPEDIKRTLAMPLAKESLAQQLRYTAAQETKTPLDVAPGSMEEIAAATTGSIAEMAPLAIASVAIRNPAPLVTWFTGRSYGSEYGKVRDEGGSVQTAQTAAALYAAAEAATEAIAGRVITQGGKSLLGSIIKGGAVEGMTEGATEALQALVDAGVVGEQMTLDEVLNRIKVASAAGAVAGSGVSAVTHGARSIGGKEAAAAEETPATPAPPEAVIADEPIENQMALPAPDTLLALPSPEMFAPPPIHRRQPKLTPDTINGSAVVADSLAELNAYASKRVRDRRSRLGLPLAGAVTEAEMFEAQVPRRGIDALVQAQFGRDGKLRDATLNPDGTISSPGAERDEAEYQARVALQRSRQAETKELLQTARETITPLGTFSTDEIGGPAAQRVNQRRIQLGRSLDAPVTIDELANAKVPQAQIDAIISARRPATSTDPLTALDITRAAKAKNIIGDDGNFGELAYRTTGSRDPMRMTQTQLRAFKDVLDTMPAHAKPVTVPIADQPSYTEDQYGKALDAVRNAGRYTAKAIKDATGLKGSKDVVALRDAMVRRGQLVQRSPNDFRLYDVLGQERQATPDDVPNGAFKDYVVRRIPVSKVRVRQDGKAVGVFGSASEARSRVSSIRAGETDKRSEIAIEPAEETAWGVLENRYDESGNLLGQVIVDSSRDEAAMRRAADQMSRPDTGAQYTQTSVEVPPKLESEPVRRAPAPEALAGRTEEVLKRLNKLASERKLPLIGARVTLKPTVQTPDGRDIEGMYFNKLLSLSAANLTTDMTTDQVVDRLAQIMDHELIHALRQAGVLGPKTDGWNTILRYARRAKRPGTSQTYFEWAKHHYTGERGYENPDTIEEEAIAEAFRHWAANKRNVVGKPATVFSQIVEWFKRLIRSVPDDLFQSIETGRMVEEALSPPGAQQPRARATRSMQAAQQGVAAAQTAGDENAVRVKSREFLRARAQAREDRYGRSGPKTVLGTTPGKAYEVAPIMDRPAVAAIVDRFKEMNGVSRGRLMTLLPEDVGYLARVADAQQRAAHDPGNNAVAKAYRALIDETRAMWNGLGPLQVTAWTGDGAPYASPADLLNDVLAGRLKIRPTADMFGPGADNAGHPLNNVSGVKTVDGLDLTHNDLLRVVHDIYGHGQSGYRDDPRGQYNAYHEHARLLSPEAARALATETLAQGSWANYGPHLRRKDGTVPRASDVDYLPPAQKEFAEQKAFLLSPDLLAADPGWALAEKAAAVEDLPKFSLPDSRVKRDARPSEIGKGYGDYVTYTDTSTGAYLQVVERIGAARDVSVVSFEVPEEQRGKGIGRGLFGYVLKQHPSLMGQVSSKAAAKIAYDAGRRPWGAPDATLDDVMRKIEEDSSVNLLTNVSEFEENLPGGRLYGNPNRSPGGALSKPGTASPALTNPRPGNQYFGGELAEHQLQMARTGDRGAALVYLSPGDFLVLTDGSTNPEQEVYNAAIDAGYKFAGYPSLVLDGYAGNVRAVQSDGAFAARALMGKSGPIPVMLYPKRAEGLGLITALEGPDGARVAFPNGGFQEFDPSVRGPRYSVGSPEFRRWFRDSKAVDENGAPLVVYHGTGVKFNAFNPKARGITDGGMGLEAAGVRPFFFSASKEIATDFAGGNADYVMATYLSLQNPLEVDAAGRGWTEYHDTIVDAAKGGEYDGVILRNLNDTMFGGWKTQYRMCSSPSSRRRSSQR